jgi:hypothetical protein
MRIVFLKIFSVLILTVLFCSCATTKSGFDYSAHRKQNKRNAVHYSGDLTKYNCRRMR